MAQHRHKRETRSRRLINSRPRVVVVAAPLAVLATAGAVSLGLLTAEGRTTLPQVASGPAVALDPASQRPVLLGPSAADVRPGRRVVGVSRGSDRAVPLTTPDVLTPAQKLMRPSRVSKAIAAATSDPVARYATTGLNLWTDPTDAATNVGELDAGARVLLTGRSMGGRDEVVVGAHSAETRWVTTGYLSADKPVAAAAGLSMAPCPDSGVESGLTASAVYVYRSVCHAFPQITTYGGYSPNGEHASGKAIDIMTTDPALLTAIGDYLRAHAAELNLYDVIRLQHIWTPVRSAEGWRAMEDRGSTTANHYDHVHVSTN